MEKHKDAFGREIYDYYQGKGGFEIIESETGYFDLSSGLLSIFANIRTGRASRKRQFVSPEAKQLISAVVQAG